MKGAGMRSKLLIGVFLVVALLGVACGGDDEPEASDGGDAGGDSAVTLAAANFAFDPATVSASAGDTIEFTNDDDVEHNLTAEDAGLDQDVEAGESTTIDLADVEPGTYEFFCKYHPDQMKGTLEVQ
jgi:plastocyanin